MYYFGLVICDIFEHLPILACFPSYNSSNELLNNDITYSKDTRYISDTNAVNLANMVVVEPPAAACNGPQKVHLQSATTSRP